MVQTLTVRTKKSLLRHFGRCIKTSTKKNNKVTSKHNIFFHNRLVSLNGCIPQFWPGATVDNNQKEMLHLHSE